MVDEALVAKAKAGNGAAFDAVCSQLAKEAAVGGEEGISKVLQQEEIFSAFKSSRSKSGCGSGGSGGSGGASF